MTAEGSPTEHQIPIELILLRQAASYLAVPIWLVSESGDLLYYNEPAEATVGRRFEEAGEIASKDLATLFRTTAEDGSPLAADDLPINVALARRRADQKRIRICSLDGVWRTIDVIAFPINGQAGRRLGAIAIFWEVEPA